MSTTHAENNAPQQPSMDIDSTAKLSVEKPAPTEDAKKVEDTTMTEAPATDTGAEMKEPNLKPEPVTAEEGKTEEKAVESNKTEDKAANDGEAKGAPAATEAAKRDREEDTVEDAAKKAKSPKACEKTCELA